LKRRPKSGRRAVPGSRPPRRRRVFLAITVAQPGAPLRALPRVEADATRLARLFGELGYRLAPLIRNPSAPRLRAQLGGWLDDAGLGPDDEIVIYYSGHGCIADGTHYLCTAGFDRDQLATSAFRTEEVVEMVVRRQPRPGKLWLILDCCQAGGVMTDGLFRALGTSEMAGFVLAASGSWGETTNGSFTAALESTIANGRRQPAALRSLDAVTASLNARRLGHPAVQASLSSARFDFLDAADESRTVVRRSGERFRRRGPDGARPRTKASAIVLRPA
jgi:hypothetical protein